MQGTNLAELESDAIAEIFWRAFHSLSESQQRAVTRRLLGVFRSPQTAVDAPIARLSGLVAWGGDAVVDSERLYGQ